MAVRLQTVMQFSRGGETTAARAADEARTRALVTRTQENLPPDEYSRVQARRANFDLAAQRPPANAQILGLWSEHERGGLPRFRWHGPGDVENFYISVRVSGDPDRVAAELWTNINHNANPSDFEAWPMERVGQNGDVYTYRARVPVERLGNFRVTARISTTGNPENPLWQWAGQAGISDVRFRPRAVEDEDIAEQVVHVGLANAGSDGIVISTFRDLMDPTFGKYNLQAIKAAGKNTIRLQPPFVAERWSGAPAVDTLGSPYAATDFFSIDPRYSRDAQQSGVPAWDRDRLRQIANAEFWDFVRAAHAEGFKVILDIALNHTGHDTIIRDLFDDPVNGERVLRNNFDQITINSEQTDAVRARLQANPYGTGEQIFPELWANRNFTPEGAHSADQVIAGGNGEWPDTEQLNTGAYNWGGLIFDTPLTRSVTDYLTRVMKHWVAPPPSETGGVQIDGVDGYRVDHSTNMPPGFWERSITQLHAMVDKPLVIIQEDFNQAERLRVYGDAMEGGWYRDLINAFRNSNIPAIWGIVKNPYFFETLRGGNHDEERIINQFGGDMMATGRYLDMLDLFGGISTTVMGDEFGEAEKLRFKQVGARPDTLRQAAEQRLPQPNINLQTTVRRAGEAKVNDPSLRTVLTEPLGADGPEGNILAMARHADDKSIPPTLVFTNLANGSTLTNKFWLDDESRSRIDPDAWYWARDLMSDNPGQNAWPANIRGADLLNNGVFVQLRPYQIQALKLERVG
jgi:hypothetical protein